MTVTIYHNPACGTSRNTLAMIRAGGVEPKVVEYLKTPPSRTELVKLIKAMGISLLIAESNVTNAARVADRLYAIDRGEILFEGEPRQALDNADVMRTLRG